MEFFYDDPGYVKTTEGGQYAEIQNPLNPAIAIKPEMSLTPYTSPTLTPYTSPIEQPQVPATKLDLTTLIDPYVQKTQPATTSPGITQTGQPLQPVGKTSTMISSWITPKTPAPTMEPVSPLVAPKVDEARISSIARDVADPYLRKLRSTTKEQLSKHYDNIMVASMNRRNILAGMGDSLASVLTSSRREGRAQETSERQMQYNVDFANKQIEVNRKNQVYQAAWNVYEKLFTQQVVTTDKYLYSTEETSPTGSSLAMNPTQTKSYAPMLPSYT